MVEAFLWRGVVLLCGVLLAQAVAAADLDIRLEQSTIETGRPVWLTLVSNQTAVSLNTLDFTPWQGKVVLPRAYDVNLTDDGRGQTLRLRLYPLHKGRLILPGLHFLYHTTQALTINVIEARDAKRDAPIDFQYRVSTRMPWQQQQVIVACTITMQDQYAVFTQPTQDSRNDLRLLPMQVQRHRITQAAGTQTVYELGWIIIPTHAGDLHLQLPPVQYVQDGVVSHRFYVPPLTLAVQARPAWLPGTIPVGRVRITRYDVSGPWLSTGVLAHVHLHFDLEGMLADAIPAYALQLRSDPALRYYAAQQQLHTVRDPAGIHHRLSEDIPLVAKHIGIYRMPALRLQYFDPVLGTLRTSTVPGPLLLVLNGWLKGLMLLLSAALLLWWLRAVLHVLVRSWRRYQTYQLALKQLLRTESLTSIRQVMQTMAQAEGWSRNLTFGQWHARMQALTPLARQLTVSQLNAAGYGQAELEIAPVVRLLVQIGRQRRLVMR